VGRLVGGRETARRAPPPPSPPPSPPLPLALSQPPRVAGRAQRLCPFLGGVNVGTGGERSSGIQGRVRGRRGWGVAGGWRVAGGGHGQNPWSRVLYAGAVPARACAVRGWPFAVACVCRCRPYRRGGFVDHGTSAACRIGRVVDGAPRRRQPCVGGRPRPLATRLDAADVVGAAQRPSCRRV